MKDKSGTAKDKKALYAAWNELQPLPTKKDGNMNVKTASAELAILVSLRRLGDDNAPNGLEIREQIRSRRAFINLTQRTKA